MSPRSGEVRRLFTPPFPGSAPRGLPAAVRAPGEVLIPCPPSRLRRAGCTMSTASCPRWRISSSSGKDPAGPATQEKLHRAAILMPVPRPVQKTVCRTSDSQNKMRKLYVQREYRSLARLQSDTANCATATHVRHPRLQRDLCTGSVSKGTVNFLSEPSRPLRRGTVGDLLVRGRVQQTAHQRDHGRVALPHRREQGSIPKRTVCSSEVPSEDDIGSKLFNVSFLGSTLIPTPNWRPSCSQLGCAKTTTP